MYCPDSTVLSVQYSTVQYRTCTVLYSTVQYNACPTAPSEDPCAVRTHASSATLMMMNEPNRGSQPVAITRELPQRASERKNTRGSDRAAPVVRPPNPRAPRTAGHFATSAMPSGSTTPPSANPNDGHWFVVQKPPRSFCAISHIPTVRSGTTCANCVSPARPRSKGSRGGSPSGARGTRVTTDSVPHQKWLAPWTTRPLERGVHGGGRARRAAPEATVREMARGTRRVNAAAHISLRIERSARARELRGRRAWRLAERCPA